jgi:hypothetical protein
MSYNLDNEKEVIQDWLKYNSCKEIRRYFSGKKVSSKYKKEAELLDKMLITYDSGLNKNEPIYRGIRFLKTDIETQKNLLLMLITYKEAFKNNGLIKIDNAPSSFSRNKDVALKEFAQIDNENYNSVVFHLLHREKGELYIKDFAGKFAYQDEIVVKSHNSLYKIISINEHNGNITIEIVEVRDE